MATYLKWDTQGPCPDGYHVPTKDEWKVVVDAGVALGQWSSSDGDSLRIKLKLPFAGSRDYDSTTAYSQGSYGYYWSSSSYSSAYYAYSLNFNSSYVNPQRNIYRPYGSSVRCFRNLPIKPSASWTTIYAGSNGSGIYHSASEGVISISSDGQTWITIADKNLGATTVYNDGDSLSQANCGNYYQWGNNYGFPWTGTISKTSSTAVDASAYGPGNYYSSDTFTTANPWDSSDNRNLWGGVTDERPLPPRIIKKFYHMGVEYKIKGGKPTPSTYTPGIYHNASLGLISLSSDGSNWTTIADKNVGATQVYDGTSTSFSDAVCGGYFQYGNNYGFSYDLNNSYSTSRVNASGYGPGNYYSSSTFIKYSNTYWDSSLNYNLWGDITNTKEARRGPCDEGYHIPTKEELDYLLSFTSQTSLLQKYFKLPLSGYIHQNTSKENRGSYLTLLSSSLYEDNKNYVYAVTYYTSGTSRVTSKGTNYGYPIRAFKNTPVVPDGSWTVLYQ